MRSDTHKVLHPIAGRPLLLHLLDRVDALGATRRVVVVGKGREQVQAALVSQIASPVLWVDSVKTLIDEGCDSFLELGAGRTLSGLVRQINSDVETFSADSPKKLSKFAERSGA